MTLHWRPLSRIDEARRLCPYDQNPQERNWRVIQAKKFTGKKGI